MHNKDELLKHSSFYKNRFIAKKVNGYNVSLKSVAVTVESLKGYFGEVVLVGVNYDTGESHGGEFKKQECRIEKMSIL